MLLLNLLLAFAWAAMTGQMTMTNFAAGMIVGYAALYVISLSNPRLTYCTRVLHVLRLAALFVVDLTVATLRVAIDIVTPRHRMSPAVLEIPLDGRSEAEITTLANMITLTPGTLTLDTSPDGSRLIVHAMYARRATAARLEIESGLGRRVREVFR